jgi:hypothetical protein
MHELTDLPTDGLLPLGQRIDVVVYAWLMGGCTHAGDMELDGTDP